MPARLLGGGEPDYCRGGREALRPCPLSQCARESEGEAMKEVVIGGYVLDSLSFGLKVGAARPR